MSIEKLNDLSETQIECIPFTQISNLVTEHIKDNDAYRLYVYLASKSRNWKIIKEWSAKQCGVGERKAKQCWGYLERCGLLEYLQVRNENGKFIKHDVRILNGTKFNPEEPFLNPKLNDSIQATGAETAPVVELSTENASHWCRNPPGGETTRVDFAPQLNKDITNKDFETKKTKSFYKEEQKKANEQKHNFADSMNQMANEKKHIEEHNKIKEMEIKEGMPNEIREKMYNDSIMQLPNSIRPKRMRHIINDRT